MCLPKASSNDLWRRLVLHLHLPRTQAAALVQSSVCAGNVLAGTEAIGGVSGLFFLRMTRFDALRVDLALPNVQCIHTIVRDCTAGPT